MNELSLTCSGLTDLVTEYLDGALDSRQALTFETHAVFCPGCRVFLGQIRETVERLHGLTTVSPSAEERDVVVEAFRSRA